MAETKVDKVAETIERRDIRRNFSNQIISYGLPEDGKLKYGYKRLPAQSVVYSEESYDKSIDRLSTELISNVGDLRIIEQTLNYVEFLTPSGEAEFEDTFSGRYAITNGAAEVPGGGKSWTGYKDNHYINPYVAPDKVTPYKNHGSNFKFGGYRTIPFDNTEEGPGLKDGGYVITQELKDSGKSLKLTAIIGVANELVDSNGARNETGVQFKFKFNRIRKPYVPNISDNLGNARYQSVRHNSYPFIKVEFDVLNSKMQVGDIWELQGQVTTAYRGCFFYGNKSIFKVDVIDTPLVPTKTTLGGASTIIQEIGDETPQSTPATTGSPTISGGGSVAGVGSTNPRSGAGAGSAGSPSGAGSTSNPQNGAGSDAAAAAAEAAARKQQADRELAKKIANRINQVRIGKR